MFDLFLKALRFASEKHAAQRRKGCETVPYINHLIKVTDTLYFIGNETDPELLAAALLHDVMEDTPTTVKELAEKFGQRVANLVKEVTDDMTLSYEDRKRYQIQKALIISNDAKKIKIADKISNINDMMELPITWSIRRKRQYIEWSELVIENCTGVNSALDRTFIETVQKAKREIEAGINN
jgi:guanosine-3',5'-bis(diphosphate) 3'-pyrophosphohydrolase